MLGQWDPIVGIESWWAVQDKLDDEERVTNTTGSSNRKHLGSGLYCCAICGEKMTGAPRGYRCAKPVQLGTSTTPAVTSLMRSGAAIDDFVTEVIARRLSQPDASHRHKKEALAGDPKTRGIMESIREQQGRIRRAERDYDAELIEGRDLKRIRDAAQAQPASTSWSASGCCTAAPVPSCPSSALRTPPRRSARKASTSAGRSPASWPL